MTMTADAGFAPRVLVVGAAGLLGMEVCRRLVARGVTTRAFYRAGSAREEEIKALGVELAPGDLKDRASLETACQGVDAVVATATAIMSKDSLRRVDRTGYLKLIKAAKTAGVKRFVYISASPNLSGATPLVAHKRRIEAALKASDLTWTVLQPSSFMEVWLGPALEWKLAEGKVRVFGRGDRPISFIFVSDVGAWAVAVLDEPKAYGQAIPLGGPRALPPLEVVKIFETALGKPLKVSHVPAAAPKIAAAVLKPFNPKLASLMGLAVDAMRGDAIDMSKARSIASVQETSVEDYARRQAAM
jgi:uncharacterized protein YbjT (DUF2867 family)